jgi:hypothetical protein
VPSVLLLLTVGLRVKIVSVLEQFCFSAYPLQKNVQYKKESYFSHERNCCLGDDVSPMKGSKKLGLAIFSITILVMKKYIFEIRKVPSSEISEF